MSAKNEIKNSKGPVKHWCFTHYTTDKDPIKFDEKTMTYLIYQKEICPTTKKPHWQGFVSFTTKRTMKTAVKFFVDNGVHLSKANGTQEQNRAYCSKFTSAAGEAPKIFGAMDSHQGARTDLESFVHAVVKENKENHELIESHPVCMLRYSSHAEKLRLMKIKPRTEMTIGEWHFGPPGTGKSEYAHSFKDAMWKSANKWWDTYRGQDVVVIDEVGKGDWSRTEICRLVDKYPLLLEIKGTMAHFNSKRIIFTSNFRPEEVFGTEKFEAIKRRLEVWEHAVGKKPTRIDNAVNIIDSLENG